VYSSSNISSSADTAATKYGFCICISMHRNSRLKKSMASQGQNAKCVVWHNDSKHAATVQMIFCTTFVREPPTNMPIYKWDSLFMRLVALEVKHTTSTSRGVTLKARDGLNPKFNLTSWAAKYTIIFPRPSIFVNFSTPKNGRS